LSTLPSSHTVDRPRRVRSSVLGSRSSAATSTKVDVLLADLGMLTKRDRDNDGHEWIADAQNDEGVATIDELFAELDGNELVSLGR
jgi:hypothetical protein